MRFIFYKVSHVLFQIYLILLTRKESIFLYIKKKKAKHKGVLPTAAKQSQKNQLLKFEDCMVAN